MTNEQMMDKPQIFNILARLEREMHYYDNLSARAIEESHHLDAAIFSGRRDGLKSAIAVIDEELQAETKSIKEARA